MRVWIAGALGTILVSGIAMAQEPAGEQFQVNTYTTDMQILPSVAVESQGSFVVVWQSKGSDGTDTSVYSIQAQRYDADGAAVGGQLQVNSYTTSYQWEPAVTANNPSGFVVVWGSKGSYGTDTSAYSIQAQRYDANGASAGGQFQVNSYTTSYQKSPAVAADGVGNFVVAWRSQGSDGSDTDAESIQAQRYDATGTPVGGQFQVNSYTTSFQDRVAVAVELQGSFVVVWQSEGSDGSDTDGVSIQAQRYDANGVPVGGQFQVNSYTNYHQFSPSVAVDPGGDFVVVWHSNGSYGTDTSDMSIQAQRYDANGAPLGGQFQVNSYTNYNQLSPSVAVDPGGNFVVTWRSDGSYGTDSSRQSIQAQRYDANGTPVGGEFQVNSYTMDYQRAASVAVDNQGDFVVIWESAGSYGTDSDGRSIQGQRFAAPIFTDGFESGDTSLWTRIVQ